MSVDYKNPAHVAADIRQQNARFATCWTKFEFLTPEGKTRALEALVGTSVEARPDGGDRIILFTFPHDAALLVAQVALENGGDYWGRKASRLLTC